MFDAYKNYGATMGNGLDAAKGYVGAVLGGKFANGNPQLQGMIDQTNESVADRVNSLFARSGQTGSSRQIGELGKQLSNAENNLRYQNYSDEQKRMMDAVSASAGLNSADNANAQTLAALGGTAAEIPYTGANNLTQGMQSLWGKSTTTKLSGNIGQLLMQAAGSAASAWAGGGFK